MYGTIDINHNEICTNNISVYEWIIKILNVSERIAIGVDSSNKECVNCDFSDLNINSNSFYSYVSSTYKTNKALYCKDKLINYDDVDYGQDFLQRYD